MTPLLRRLRLASRLTKIALWVVCAVSAALAVADVLSARPWYSAAAAAGGCLLCAALLGRPPRCGHYAQAFRDVRGLGYNCRRRIGHRGLHKDGGIRWDTAGRFLNTDRGHS
jgi:hypothetical protein